MNDYADIDTLLHTTDDAFCATLHAVLEDDRHAAREVLHGSAARRATLSAAQDSLRERTWVPGPQLANELQFVADIGRVGEVVDHLARHVVGGADRRPLTPARRMEVAVLCAALAVLLLQASRHAARAA